jgi:hypothetical protein
MTSKPITTPRENIGVSQQEGSTHLMSVDLFMIITKIFIMNNMSIRKYLRKTYGTTNQSFKVIPKIVNFHLGKTAVDRQTKTLFESTANFNSQLKNPSPGNATQKTRPARPAGVKPAEINSTITLAFHFRLITQQQPRFDRNHWHSRFNMPKRNKKPEAKAKRQKPIKEKSRSNSVQEIIELDSSSPEPTKRQSRSRTRRTKRKRTPSSSASNSDTETTTNSKRPSVLGDVRKTAYHPESTSEEDSSRSRSPRYKPRPTPEPESPKNSARRKGSPKAGPSRYSPVQESTDRHKKKSRRSGTPVSPNGGDQHRDVSPFWGSQLDYEYNSDSNKSSPVRDDPKRDLRDRIGHSFTVADDLRRHLTATISPPTLGTPPGPINSQNRFRSRSWISGYRCTIKKLLVTNMEGSAVDIESIPWEGSPPDKDHFKQYDDIKATHCLLPGCTKAVYTEEMQFMPIMIRIKLYCQGRVRILGSRYDHGLPVVGDIRPESVRIACVLKAIRADFMRHTGLWDRGNIEAVALTFHPELFDQGQLLTDSGGIPGCPGPLTEPQRQEHRTSSEDIMEFMVELHRKRMKHNADRTKDDNLHPEERFRALHILRAAAEMNKLCEGKKAPQCAIDFYKRLYGPDNEVTVEKSAEEALLDEIDEVIQDITPPSSAENSSPELRPTGKMEVVLQENVPGIHCAMAKAFLEGHKRGGNAKCEHPTCIIGSEFLKDLQPEDNLKPDHPHYDHITFEEAGSRSKMLQGPQDLRKDGERVFWHLDEMADLPGTLASMEQARFIDSVMEHGCMTVGTNDFIRGDLDLHHPGHVSHQGPKVTANVHRTFATAHFGAPNGGLLVVHANFNGYTYQGQLIPDPIKDLLRNPDILLLQFGIENVLERLSAGGIISNAWVDVRNIAMLAYPQPEFGNDVSKMKDGIDYVARMLDAPIKFFSVQRREKMALKARVAGVRHGPPEPSVPSWVPDWRIPEKGKPLYTENERRQRRNHWNTIKNTQDIPLDYACDDFSMPGNVWNWRMKLWAARDHVIPFALCFRMCYRLSILHHLSAHADSVRHMRYLQLSLREVRLFKDFSPSEKGYRPGGRINWMVCDSSIPDVPFMANPFLATEGYNRDSDTRVIANGMASSYYTFQVDAMGLSRGFREELEALNKGKLDRVDLATRIARRFTRTKERPHCCEKCGSGEHRTQGCLGKAEDIQCCYPRCLSNKHVLATCPMVINRCLKCKRLGHMEEDHKGGTPWVVLMNDFMAASAFHHLAIFVCERLTASMIEENGIFAVKPRVDFNNKKYASMMDRCLLSTIPYQMPY